MITFTVPGSPIPQPRTKATRRGTHAGVYTPTKTSTGRSNGIAEYKALVRAVAAKAHTGAPIERPVNLEVEFVFPRMAGMVWKKKPMPSVPHVKKPDLDNLLKSLKDALKEITWRDDCQVCYIEASKRIAAGDEQPHTTVVITEL